MFNLEQNITEWRRQMRAAGINTPVPLEELESHLREEVEQQVRAGWSEEAAFHQAARQMGAAGALQGEFTKIQSTIKRKHMLKLLLILAALFGSIFGGAMVLPALGRWRDTGVLPVSPLILGTVIALVAGAAAWRGLRHYREARGRKLITIGVVAAGGFYVVPLVQAFFMPQITVGGWIFCGVLAAASVLFYGKCFLLNRNLAAVK